MTDVITKVSIGGQVYSFAGGGGSSGEEHEFITQEEYEQLTPAQQAEKVYMITGEGETPTPGGGTAVERGDMLLTSIGGASEDEKYLGKGSGTAWQIVTKEGINKTSFSCQLFVIQDGYVYYGYDNTFHKINISTGVDETVTVYTGGGYLNNKKRADGYMYFSNSSVCKKVSSDNLTVTDSTITDYNAIPSGLYYKGLYYSQDGNDYVAVDSTDTEVKRYSEVGTINGIYNDKLYRNVGANEASTLAYAVATI